MIILFKITNFKSLPNSQKVEVTKYPSTGERVNSKNRKLFGNNNKVLVYTTMWIDLENIMLNQ